MLILIKILSFLLDSVVEKNPFIQLILDLIEIVKILFAPVVSLQTLSRARSHSRGVTSRRFVTSRGVPEERER